MKIHIVANAAALGAKAAVLTAEKINAAVKEQGEARIVLSTGASQLTTLAELVRADIDWSRVTMFHLDEYVNLPESHKASFRKYLKERFVANLPLPLKHAYWVDGNPAHIPELTAALCEKPIDVGLIGIGENAHIAFNDPPADFETDEAYITVNLNETCKKQQVGEGWFPTVGDVPKQAISMTVREILKCRTIISCVPYAVKADAIRKTLTNDITNQIPATILKGHPDYTLFCDADSFASVSLGQIRRVNGCEIGITAETMLKL